MTNTRWVFVASLAVGAAFICARPASAQSDVPVIRAHSRVVTIVDGLHVKKNYWYVMPERALDVYYVEIPRRPHTVTFTTDLASISFSVTYGSEHDFIIKLDDGTESRTRIRATNKSLLAYQRARPRVDDGADLIPFTLGDNDKIYVKGRLNGGDSLDFQFDLGAGGGIIKQSSIPKTNMVFDGTANLRNSDGDNVVRSSSANHLEIAGLRWDSLQFLVADNMTRREDGLVGNILFHDRVLKIDYDRMVISIYDSLPPLSGDWLAQDIVLDGAVPFIRGALSVGDTTLEGWYLFDTGAYTSILNTPRLSAVSKFVRQARRMLGPLGGRPRGPAITVGGRTFTETNYTVHRYDGDVSALGLVGNDIMKRFNVVLDNREGRIYFQPSSRRDEPFRNPEFQLARIIGVAGVLGAAALVWRVRRGK
jgi:hypothetical protein